MPCEIPKGKASSWENFGQLSQVLRAWIVRNKMCIDARILFKTSESLQGNICKLPGHHHILDSKQPVFFHTIASTWSAFPRQDLIDPSVQSGAIYASHTLLSTPCSLLSSTTSLLSLLLWLNHTKCVHFLSGLLCSLPFLWFAVMKTPLLGLSYLRKGWMYP